MQLRNRLTICTTISQEDKEYLVEKNITVASAIQAQCNSLRELEGESAGKVIRELRETIEKMGNNLAKVTGLLIDAVGFEQYKNLTVGNNEN